MTPVPASELLVPKLGWTLLHFLWQGTVIAAAFAIFRVLLGGWLSTRGRYVLACMALMAMAAAPALTFLLIPDVRRTGAWTITAAESQILLPAVVTLWLAGVAGFSIRLLAGWRFTSRLRSTSHPAPSEWRRTIERISARIGATQSIRLQVSSLVGVPTVVGWLRPAILVPVEFFTGLPLAHITALLAHEMAHIRRHDYLVNMAQSVVEAVLFYHPAVWWVSEQIRAERELCCDDLAVAATGDALGYARALAELESRQPARITPVLAANGGSLVNRVRRLIEPAHPVVNSGPGAVAAWAMTLLWVAGTAAAALHGGRTPSPLVIAAAVPARTPAPSLSPVGIRAPLIAAADKARNTLLYDPLLPTQRTLANERAAIAVVLPEDNIPEPPPVPVIVADTIGNTLSAPMALSLPSGPPHMPPEETPQQMPTFNAAARLVQVDVIARHKGIAANGLTKEDFTLLDNGRPQRIAVFSVASSQALDAAFVPLPAGTVSNRLDRDGDSLTNATVVLIDQINTAPADQAFAIRRITKFLAMRRTPDRKADRIGIYTLGREGLRAVQEITDNAGLLRQAADSLISPDTSYEHGPERVMATKRALETIARHLASVPGRKGLIWVTGGFPLSIRGFDPNPYVDEAARTLNDADVALYAVDARGLIGSLSGMTAVSNAEFRGSESTGPLSSARFLTQEPESLPQGIEAMARLAGLTGGLALYNTNGIEDSMRKAFDDAELTYTLGFYPGPQDEDRLWHKLKIEVARPGISVRYRTKYFASAALTEKERPTLPELLKIPLDATQLQLVAETMPDPVRPDFRKVRVSVNLHQVHLENRDNKWAGGIDVSFFLEGSKIARTITRNLEIPDAQLDAAMRKGFVVDDSVGVDSRAGGTGGQLRIVAQDRATGAAGSLRIPLDRR